MARWVSKSELRARIAKLEAQEAGLRAELSAAGEANAGLRDQIRQANDTIAQVTRDALRVRSTGEERPNMAQWAAILEADADEDGEPAEGALPISGFHERFGAVHGGSWQPSEEQLAHSNLLPPPTES